jgi:hypothetical protein
MSEDTYKPLLMGYLDAELTETEVERFEQHLKECVDCSAELAQFRRLKEVTQNMRVVAPDEKYWDVYWSNIYNRLERRIGWILMSLGAILLLSYGIYVLILELFVAQIPVVVRIGVLAFVVGIVTLLVSVVRERIFLAKADKYERIKR